MKPQAIARTFVIAMFAGLSPIASAVESEKKLPDTAPVAPIEKSDDEARLADWEEKEVELIKVLKEVVAAQAEGQKHDTAADWQAVEANVKRYIFKRVSDKGGASWPEAQFAWVRDARIELQRDERHEKRKFSYGREAEALVALEERLAKEVQAMKGPAEAEPDKTSNLEEDETLWKFRDKGGSRTTKPRYKGQEPLN